MKKINKLKNTFFASCAFGTEDLLIQELAELKITEHQVASGGVEFVCFPQFALEFLLTTKIASRVYKTLYSFDIKNEGDLYFRGKEIKWNAIFNLDQTFKIKVTLGTSPINKKRSQFRSPVFLSQKFKDAIADAFREKMNKRPNVDTKDADASLLLKITPHDNEFAAKEEVKVLIDLSGEPLSNRGYRLQGGEAPLRENLAASLVRTMAPVEGDFVDLMSGSGTVAIETALFRGGIPGQYLELLRCKEEDLPLPYLFLDLNFYTKDEKLIADFEAALIRLHEKIDKGFKLLQTSKQRITANELDSKNLNKLQANIEESRFKGIIEVIGKDATQLQLPLKGATLFANPPYGERLEVEDLENLYHELGENLKQNYQDCTAYVFTGNLEMIKKISLRTSSKTTFYNGNIESRLVKYELY